MVRRDSFSSVPPHIQPPMAQVPSAIRELMRFVPLISIYSSMLSFVLSRSLVSLAAQRARRDVIAAGQVFHFVGPRFRFPHPPPQGLCSGRAAVVSILVPRPADPVLDARRIS